MRHALSVALQDFQGAMVVVSHDRHLLRSVTDQLLLVSGGKVQPFDGDLDDYRVWLNEQKKSEEKPTENLEPTVSRKDQRKADAETRRKYKPLYDALKKAEDAVEKFHAEQKQLEQQLTDPLIYEEAEKKRLKQVLDRKVQVDKLLEEAEFAWMDAEEQVAAIQ
jgi:ATP-binding cassette subfamily F protein 3